VRDVEPTAAPAKPTLPPPPPPTPTAVPIRAHGLLVWHDDTGRSDGALLSVDDLPALSGDNAYGAWLSGPDGNLFLGTLEAPSPVSGGNTRALNFAAPDHENLPSEFDSVLIARAPSAWVDTASPADVVAVAGGKLPPQALVHLRHALAGVDETPQQVAFAVGLRQESDKVLVHAQFLQDAVDESNLANVLFHAEHLVNMIEGKQGEHFGDLNGNGIIENPGDGFGLLENGSQAGYVKGLQETAQLAAAAPDATESIKLHAGHVVITGDNTRGRLTMIRDLALQVSKVRRAADAREHVQRILALSHQMIDGVDLNGDEQISPVPGEGGVLTAYQHAQLMAGIEVAPATAAALAPTVAPTVAPTLAATLAPTRLPTAAPTAPAAPQPARVELAISDDAFTPKSLSVPVGATVVWNRSGTHPHTVTADDNSFDSGILRAGQGFEHTFTRPGTFAYYCDVHGGPGGEGMSGTVTVQ
jgi:plastocyanin